MTVIGTGAWQWKETFYNAHVSVLISKIGNHNVMKLYKSHVVGI